MKGEEKSIALLFALAKGNPVHTGSESIAATQRALWFVARHHTQPYKIMSAIVLYPTDS